MATKQKDAEPIRKITVRDVLGVAPKADPALMKTLLSKPKDVIPLMRVIGLARVSKLKVTDNGESFAFIGQFKATALYGENKGSDFSAPKCYLPRFLEEELVGLLGSGNTGEGIPFAFEIGVKYDAKSATSYIYTAKPLIAAQSNALALIESQIAAKALPAPKE